MFGGGVILLQNYFIYNGKKYYSGTIIKIKYYTNIEEVVFLGYCPERNKYALKFYPDRTEWHRKNDFNKVLIEITDKINKSYENWVQEKEEQMHPKLTAASEMSIDGMLIAWVWYIFIMLVAVIFKECIGIWIFASIVFFNYRNKKLKERGYK